MWVAGETSHQQPNLVFLDNNTPKLYKFCMNLHAIIQNLYDLPISTITKFNCGAGEMSH